MSVEKYDLAIIGSGSGNSVITPYWDDKSVVIIDSGKHFGGTCLNVGCIPTKMFAYPATLAASTDHAQRLGVDLEFNGADWPAIRDRIFGRIDPISESGKKYRAEELDNTTLVSEEVHFTGPKQLTTESGRVIEADQIVVAAGSRPSLPEIEGTDLPGVHTSDTVMRLPELPEHIVVVGGGYIASEFSSVFSGLGSKVTQVVRREHLLADHDRTVSERFTAVANKEWDFHNWLEPHLIERTDEGKLRIHFHTSGAAKKQGISSEPHSVEAEVVLLATGRVSNVDRLNLDATGFDVGADQLLKTDEYMRVTSNGAPVDGVWAIGDITNTHQLKHVANHEQRVVSHNLEHPDAMKKNALGHVPAAVFSRPQVASVGLTEDEAVAEYGAENISVKVQDYGDVAFGWAMEDDHGFAKVIAEKSTGKLIGAHIMGEQASLLIQPLVQAMNFGQTAHEMARGQYWIHPALTEVVENALLGLNVPDSGLL